MLICYFSWNKHLYNDQNQDVNIDMTTALCHGLPRWLSGQECVCHAGNPRDAVSIPRSGRSPRGGHGNPLQYSCLENPMDRGVWRAAVHGATWGHYWSDWTYPLSQTPAEFHRLPPNVLSRSQSKVTRWIVRAIWLRHLSPHWSPGLIRLIRLARWVSPSSLSAPCMSLPKLRAQHIKRMTIPSRELVLGQGCTSGCTSLLEPPNKLSSFLSLLNFGIKVFLCGFVT